MHFEMSEKKCKILRLILFIVRCVLIQLLPIVRRLYMRWEPTDQEEIEAMFQWSAVYLVFILIELWIRLSTRKVRKEPVFMKLLIFTAVLSPVFILGIFYLSLESKTSFPAGLFETLNQELTSVKDWWFSSFKMVTWPYTAFLLYEVVLALIISMLNKKTFPKNKAKQDGLSAE